MKQAWAITNGPRLWRWNCGFCVNTRTVIGDSRIVLILCKFEGIRTLEVFYAVKDCLKRGCLRGVLKTLFSTRKWQFTPFDFCDLEK
jgi:hypothetical protein